MEEIYKDKVIRLDEESNRFYVQGLARNGYTTLKNAREAIDRHAKVEAGFKRVDVFFIGNGYSTSDPKFGEILTITSLNGNELHATANNTKKTRHRFYISQAKHLALITPENQTLVSQIQDNNQKIAGLREGNELLKQQMKTYVPPEIED